MSLEKAFCSAVEKCNRDIHKIVATFINTRTNDIQSYIEITLNSRAAFNLADIVSNEDLADMQNRISAVVHSNLKFLSLYDIPVKSFDLDDIELGMADINELLQQLILTGGIINWANQIGSKCYETLLDSLLNIELLDAKKIGKDIWRHICINNDSTNKIEQMLGGIMENIAVKLLNHYTYQIADYLYAKYDEIISTEDYGTPLTA
ncbi:hypothetical protein SAMN05660649_02876 [Desulfotomaculum arcticum]|uniref:Uncharacterized protein n=1 Tax=Desulfotruncus arcticus DSM 17038 TaxID=1121424 RepID=A0A1I2V3B9_9FIRM|nr:hypothetical protein [Desulfotruncus arcticus]SFG83732.1 hypothetical protein SAMN05660649_02876 [Desulfotomaculum arcticum] [Desulfotruncus arcticus DSM 17038]